MSEIALLIYLADVSSGLVVFCGIIGVISLMVGIITMFMSIDDQDLYTETRRFSGRLAKRMLPLGIIFVLMAILVPSKQTVYMLAGLKLTDKVIHTEDFQKAKSYLGETGIQMMDDIRTILHAEAQSVIKGKGSR